MYVPASTMMVSPSSAFRAQSTAVKSPAEKKVLAKLQAGQSCEICVGTAHSRMVPRFPVRTLRSAAVIAL